MNKSIRKVKIIFKNILEFVAYYSKFNLLYEDEASRVQKQLSEAFQPV